MASWVYVFGERYFSDSLIKTTSLSSVPRAKASGFPSREMAKEKICAGVNSASNFGGRFCCKNRFPVIICPSRSSRKFYQVP